MEPLRILVVDDHEAIRRGLRNLLSGSKDWLICGEATDGVEATEKARTLRPNAVLMDVSMPRMDGIQAAGRILQELPNTKIILISQNDPEIVRRQAAKIGATAFIAKSDISTELLPLLESVSAEHAASGSSEIQYTEEELRILQKVGATIASDLELRNIVQAATDAGRELSDASFGAFFYNVLDSSGGKYMLYTLSGAAPEDFDKFPMPRNTCVFAPTFSGESALRLDDVTQDSRYGHSAPYYGMPPGHLPVRSYLAVPVISRTGEVHGGLFYGHARAGVFSDRAERLVEGIARLAAAAIDNARLFETVQSARAEALANAERQRALFHLADRLHRTESLQDIYTAAIDAIFEALHCDRASILLFDESNRMNFVHSRGLSEGYRRVANGHSAWDPEDKSPHPVEIPDTETAALDSELAAAIRNEGIRALNFVPLVSGGRLIGKFMMYFNSPHQLKSQELELSLTIARQLSFAIDRVRTQEALRTNRERFDLVAQAGHVGFWFCDLPFDKLVWDNRVREHFGVPAETPVTIEMFYKQIHPDDRERTQLAIEQSIANNSTYDIEYRTLHSAQGERWIRAIGRSKRDSTGKPTSFDGITMDMTDRKRAEEAVRASEERFRTLSLSLNQEVEDRTRELELRNSELLWRTEQLRDLSRRMMQVQDNERRHVARELHDSAGQSLAVLGINISKLAKSISDRAPDLMKTVEETQQTIKNLTQEIRTTSYLLHPPLLDESGLSAALAWYVQGLSKRSGLEVRLNVAETLGRLSPDVEIVIFRLVQECLTNIHKHSASKCAEISLWRNASHVFLTIQDFGKGIPREKLPTVQSQGSGVGLRGMSERVGQFQGEMSIDSNTSGTKISFNIPVAPQPPGDPSAFSASDFISRS